MAATEDQNPMALSAIIATNKRARYRREYRYIALARGLESFRISLQANRMNTTPNAAALAR